MNTITTFFAVATLLKIIAASIESQDIEQIRSRTRRFTGGASISVQLHLFTVSIEYSEKPICAGSTISDRIILTAASCIVQKWYKKLTVRVGSTHIGRHGTLHQVDKMSTHPQFILSSQINDAALLWLNESINYENTKAKPISLFAKFDQAVLGSKGSSYGWHFIENDKNRLEGELMVTSVRIVPMKQCTEISLDKKSRRVTRGKICAYLSGAGLCSKDIGGPLIINGLQAGIAITDRNCSEPNSTLAYMEISHIRDWILNEIVALSNPKEPPVKIHPLATQEIDTNRELQGESIKFEKVPFLVSILTTVGNILACVGTIIGPNHVLTSARCSSSTDKSKFYVRSGSGNWTHGGQKHFIVDAKEHHWYRVKNLVQSSDDIAILQVEPPFAFSKTTKMVELVERDFVPHDVTLATIYGWDPIMDEVRRSNRRPMKILQSLDLRMIANDECRGLLENQGSLSERSQICASNKLGICIGPVGAPLMVGERQFGLFAWGNENCADYRFPGIFTDVAKYRSWIDAKISYKYIKHDELR
ncbi:hypothetical protein QAD02_004483 [Eretmocerus hayati]|uniref:Uncharacterized protein n=1 Tax=Eretmocerus hayati TaxID=131215 RepID=A0ACC2NQ07_9HYME|nr:hypothetical protein QAD02_004483 [Eretmocerus hayati]